MPRRVLRTPPLDFSDIREEFDVPVDFPADALTEASEAARTPPVWPRSELPFVTLDPPGSLDLDQAVHLARRGEGYRVSYAIADVSAFIRPGGPLDEATARRGVTVYSPDRRIPLHPTELSEGAASLLPGELRPAVLWEIDLDADGDVLEVGLRRASVRSVAQLDYPAVQAAVNAGHAHDSLALLPAIGELRLSRARARHAITLDLPEQEVVASPDGGWSLEFRSSLPVEKWNAEISLLTGMCAAQLMLDAGIGLLRTLPRASKGSVRRLRQVAPPLGVDWPDQLEVGDVLAGLDVSDPGAAAFVNEAATLLRGAGYAAFDGPPPAEPVHAAVAAPYAHVTAPLRRLVDRFGTEVCLAHVAGTELPLWVRERLPLLPAQLVTADRRAAAVERAVLDLVEAHLLAGRVGEDFEAVVVDVDVDDDRATVVLADPAVRARSDRLAAGLGERTRVRLQVADPAERRVRFGPVPEPPASP